MRGRTQTRGRPARPSPKPRAATSKRAHRHIHTYLHMLHFALSRFHWVHFCMPTFLKNTRPPMMLELFESVKAFYMGLPYSGSGVMIQGLPECSQGLTQKPNPRPEAKQALLNILSSFFKTLNFISEFIWAKGWSSRSLNPEYHYLEALFNLSSSDTRQGRPQDCFFCN